MPRYLIPNPIEGYEETCIKLRIPNALEYRMAVRGQLTALGKWLLWERTDDSAAVQAAEYMRQFITAAEWDAECDCEDDDDNEDILKDGVISLADGLLDNILSGGQITALGYAIDSEGSIITDTILPIIGITVLAIAAGTLIVSIGGIALAPVAVAAGETVELVAATGASASNIVELVVTLAAAA
jgi:hypothetical protein